MILFLVFYAFSFILFSFFNSWNPCHEFKVFSFLSFLFYHACLFLLNISTETVFFLPALLLLLCLVEFQTWIVIDFQIKQKFV